MSRRISFSAMNAEHLYEYLRMYWFGEADGKFGGCHECEDIGRRLETFIGPKAVRAIERAVKEHPSRNRLLIPATKEELDWLTHAASLQGVTVDEYVKRAVNDSLRKSGVDAVLLKE